MEPLPGNVSIKSVTILNKANILLQRSKFSYLSTLIFHILVGTIHEHSFQRVTHTRHSNQRNNTAERINAYHSDQSLWEWYINKIIKFFNIIHLPAFCFKTTFWRLDSASILHLIKIRESKLLLKFFLLVIHITAWLMDLGFVLLLHQLYLSRLQDTATPKTTTITTTSNLPYYSSHLSNK
jgi:hypothetical protein